MVNSYKKSHKTLFYKNIFEMIITDFKKRMKFNRNFSKCTIENYLRSIEKFNNFLIGRDKTVGECEKITIKDIETRLAIERKEKDSRTCNNYLAGIKCFLRFCKNQWKEVIDTRWLVTMREYDKKIDSLSEKEVIRLLNFLKWKEVRWSKKERLKYRDISIVTMLLYTWLRVTELINLKYSDIRDDWIQVVGKWWKRRVVYVNEEVKNNLLMYNLMRTDKSPYLFVSHSTWKTTKLSRNSVEKMLKESWEQCGIEKLTPHVLRHTFATMLLQKNAEIFYIQKLLWHKNFSTTEEYLTVLSESAKRTQSLLDDLFI